MRDLETRENTQTISGHNFECQVRDGYVFDRVWGTMTIAEAELCTQALLQLGPDSGYRVLLVELEGLDWINNLALRRRGIELFRKGTDVYKRIALVSTRPAILYLVEIMARAGGLDVRTFKDEPTAVQWLRGR